MNSSCSSENALHESLHGATVSYDTDAKSEDIRRDAVEAFITAKRIEGCSEKDLGLLPEDHRNYALRHWEDCFTDYNRRSSQISDQLSEGTGIK